jgi:otoferlin
LGSITLNLNKLVKPAKDVKKCSLRMVEKAGKVPTLNLFKNKRCKGWWPMHAREKEEGEDKDNKTAKLILKGKVEAELHLLTAEEADKNPVGLGREDPEKLPDPKRPDSSFLWIFNPLKSIRYILWKNYKWYIITFIVIIALVLLVLVFIYHMPNYLAWYVFNH